MEGGGRLTKRLIDAMQYRGAGNRRDVRWDDELSGFGVRVYPTGKKAFVLSYRVHGRKRLMTLGAYGVLTLDEARRKARAHLVAVEDGRDPLDVKKRQAAGETVRDLCQAYIERYAKVHKRTWQDDERRLAGRIVPAWGGLKASSLSKADVAALHSKIGREHPYEANRVVELLSKMFELARTWSFVPEDHPNPARGIDRFREHKRDRWVTADELPKLAQAIDAAGNVYVRAALWLYLLTGVRKSELLRAKWADVDWDRKELRLPETKAGRVHYVPISAPAQAILKQIPQVEGNPYILPSARRRRGKPADEPGHLVNISKPWRAIRAEAGVIDVRLHDLRRTVGSWLAQAGSSLHLIGRVLNHSSSATTSIYARFGQDHVRDALEAHAKRILGVAKKKAGGTVVNLRRSHDSRDTD